VWALVWAAWASGSVEGDDIPAGPPAPLIGGTLALGPDATLSATDVVFMVVRDLDRGPPLAARRLRADRKDRRHGGDALSRPRFATRGERMLSAAQQKGVDPDRRN